MTAVRKPDYPLAQLVTFELRDYRDQLERALTDTPAQSPERRELTELLADVIREQDSRTKPQEQAGLGI
jgi:hypothetical protein